MADRPQQTAPRDGGSEPRRRGQPFWFWAVLVAMLLAFGFVLVERNVIRSHWWAHRLAACDDISQQAYYINALLNVGDAASGAVRWMTSHERADVRAAAVLILGQGGSPTQIAELARMLADADREVRESVARTLAFLDRPEAANTLIEATMSDKAEIATAAAAGLSRVDSPDAACNLCRVIGRHPNAVVRAQAVESLAAMLMTSAGETQHDVASACDPVAGLVAALHDQGAFRGSLALEREIDAARGVAVSGNATGAEEHITKPEASPSRRVSEIARQSIAMLLGEQFETPSPAAPEASAKLAGLLRLRIADRGIHFELPTSLPAAAPVLP